MTQPVPMRNPRLHQLGASIWDRILGELRELAAFFTVRTPTFRNTFGAYLVLTFTLFCRHPQTNYIFDEQEALLGNPYVNQLGFNYEDAIYRDFWGLPANASIGSYRPVPNYLWRGMVEVGERGQRTYDRFVARTPGWSVKRRLTTLGGGFAGAFLLLASAGLIRSRKTWAVYPLAILLGLGVAGIWRYVPDDLVFDLAEVARRSWFQDLYNIFFHAMNGAVFTAMAWRLTRRRLTAWVTGLTFVTAAILTEAVSGVVGLADVLGGLGALLALAALSLRGHVMPFAVFLSLLLGLFSKESAIVCVPLVPVAAFLLAPTLHPERPARVVRAALAFIGCMAAFVLYTELRKRWFPSPLPGELGEGPPPEASRVQEAAHYFLVWFHQAPLPRDPLNNPLVDAPMDLRVAGACRVYFRGLTQVVFPWHLSGDYSFPQEPVPETVVFPESVLGWALTVLPLGLALGLFVVALLRERRARVPIDRTPIEVDPPEPPGPVERALKAMLGESASARLDAFWTENRQTLLRAAVEFAIVTSAILLTRKMLSIGPSPLNKDMGDSDPTHNIILAPGVLEDTMAYAACACVFFGALIETMWEPRSTAYTDWRLPVLAIGLVWLVVSYFPHSNMYVLLPTVRAERLWYFPCLGTTMVVAMALVAGFDRVARSRSWGSLAWLVPGLFLFFQGARSYLHAMDYHDDLVFWRATKDTVTQSSKAHLNYSVMAGARGMMDVRLAESHIARNLAPKWAMAHIYTGDTLCRMGRVEESWPYYKQGFELGPNDKGLISLALQCLWDTKQLQPHAAELTQLSADHPGSWLAYLADDTLKNGDKQGGVQRDSRPRGYNEGAKTEESEATTESGSADSGASGSASEALSGSTTAIEDSALPSASTSASVGEKE